MPLLDQFKENLRLAKEFARAVRDGLRSTPAAWRKATPEKLAIWLLIPSVVVVSAIGEHFSAPWYYDVAVLMLAGVLIGLGSKMRRATSRKVR